MNDAPRVPPRKRAYNAHLRHRLFPGFRGSWIESASAVTVFRHLSELRKDFFSGKVSNLEGVGDVDAILSLRGAINLVIRAIGKLDLEYDRRAIGYR